MEDATGSIPETHQNGASFRREVLEFLVSDEGRRLWRREVSSRRLSERVFYEALRRRASPDLRRLLLAIDIYERFARLAQDAFDDCLYEMTRKRGKVSATELGRLDSVKVASQRLPKMFGEVADRLEPFGQALRFQQHCALLSEAGNTSQWRNALSSITARHKSRNRLTARWHGWKVTTGVHHPSALLPRRAGPA